MKKRLLFLFAATLFAVGTVSAQGKNDYDAQDRGWWLGGQVGYWYDGESHSFAIAPEFGYDFNRRWTIGVSVGYLRIAEASAFEFAPYARRNFYLTDNFSLFVDGGFGVVCGDADGLKIGFQPGFAVQINRHIRFLTHIGFVGLRSDLYNNGLGDGVGFTLSASDLKFGFYYTF